eukprot:g76648.t1
MSSEPGLLDSIHQSNHDDLSRLYPQGLVSPVCSGQSYNVELILGGPAAAGDLNANWTVFGTRLYRLRVSIRLSQCQCVASASCSGDTLA